MKNDAFEQFQRGNEQAWPVPQDSGVANLIPPPVLMVKP